MTKPTSAESRELQTIKRLIVTALGVAVLIGVIFWWSVTDQNNRQAHDQCVASNHGRAEIKQAFADLYDGFIAATGNNERAVEFKKTQMAKLERGLPQQDCS